jgi:penicillin-binding protein 1A
VMQKTGIDKVAEIVSRFGISKEPQHYFPIGLGAVDTTVEKMLTAYSAVANGGHQVSPQYIEVIHDSSGKVIYKRPSAVCTTCNNSSTLPSLSIPEGIRLTDAAHNYQFISLMEGVVQRGTAARASKLGKVIAGKTGTTNDSMDTWFIGFTPLIATATYIGFDTPKTLGKSATGSSVALPIFIDFMEHAYKNTPSLPFKIPDSIIQIKVDPNTGKPSDIPGAILESFPKNYNTHTEQGDYPIPQHNYSIEKQKDLTKQFIDSGIY